MKTKLIIVTAAILFLYATKTVTDTEEYSGDYFFDVADGLGK